VDDILAPSCFRLNEEQGITIIMIEHIMRAVMRFSERIVSSTPGERIAEGTPEEIVGNQAVRRPTLASRIVVREVDAGYGAVRVLHGVSIEVREGETVALLGTNGNGKSTLIKCIMGMVTPEAGEIVLETDGARIDLTRKSTEEIVGLGIALVPEGRRLFPKLSVEENLLLGAYRPEARADIAANLDFSFEASPCSPSAGASSRGA
jgi:ABC-type branched-subunit amino acid transport system ATPase component